MIEGEQADEGEKLFSYTGGVIQSIEERREKMELLARRRWLIVIVLSLALMLMGLTIISGCGDNDDKTEPAEKVEEPQEKEMEEVEPAEPSNTPQDAVDAYLEEEGMNPAAVDLAEKTSKEDPTWAIFTGSDDVGDNLTIILHVEDGEWTVVEAGSSFPQWPPDIPGAPDDLFE
jgi:hypothetical protein